MFSGLTTSTYLDLRILRFPRVESRGIGRDSSTTPSHPPSNRIGIVRITNRWRRLQDPRQLLVLSKGRDSDSVGASYEVISILGQFTLGGSNYRSAILRDWTSDNSLPVYWSFYDFQSSS